MKTKEKTRRRPNIDRLAQEGLVDGYFSDNLTYSEDHICRHFWMDRNLFLRIVRDVQARNAYFLQQADATGRLGLTTFQKCIAAIRQLAYGSFADATDEYD